MTFQSEAKLGQFLLSISLWLQLVRAPLGDACQRELEHLGKALRINQGSPLLSPAATSPWLEEPYPVGRGSWHSPADGQMRFERQLLWPLSAQVVSALLLVLPIHLSLHSQHTQQNLSAVAVSNAV